MGSRLDTSMSQEEVDGFLKVARTAVLCTNGADGFPHAIAMWFVRGAEDELWMWTYAKSRKARNLRRDTRFALMVEAGERYEELRGVLIRGRARLLTDPKAVASIGSALYERYGLTQPENAGALRTDIERQAAKRVGVILPIERVSSWDHRKLG